MKQIYTACLTALVTEIERGKLVIDSTRRPR